MKSNNKSQKYGEILLILMSGETFAVSEIHQKLNGNLSLISIKRKISEMLKEGFLFKIGDGRSTRYQISNYGRIHFVVDSQVYCEEESDKRIGLSNFNFSLFESLSNIFSEEELKNLKQATKKYHDKIKNTSLIIHQKELERFIIELSWKSSKIEGNTYTLLDTEKLLKDGIEAIGKSKDEATMIINHKNAFDFIYDQKDFFKDITVSKIEEIHKILIKDLNVTNNLRSKPVGILGSKYMPLDNQFQIREALESLCVIVNEQNDPYSKAILSILGVSYIQPFEDGNKRTSRLLGNAVLLAHGLAPLSYRIVEEEVYREAILVFYELNSIVPFKNIFRDQYVFSTDNYLI